MGASGLGLFANVFASFANARHASRRRRFRTGATIWALAALLATPVAQAALPPHFSHISYIRPCRGARDPGSGRHFGPLYADVESRRLLGDSKIFADAVPRRPPSTIPAAYRRGAPWGDAALRSFVAQAFVLPPATLADIVASSKTTSIDEHIEHLRPILARPPPTPGLGASVLALPKLYVVPGGRFRNRYYWDSYFTMLGLKRDGHGDLVNDMIDDFGATIDRYGHIPNGLRTY